jgi:hypothetical protein
MEHAKTFEVYGISDIGDPRRIRYVGMTRVGMEERLKGHWKDARRGLKRPLSLWLGKRSPDEVLIVLIESLDGEGAMCESEINWISHYRSLGMADLNLAKGGIGNPLPHSEKSKDKLRAINAGRKMNWSPSEKHRKAVGDSARKRLSGPEAKAAHAEKVGRLKSSEVLQIKRRLWMGESQSTIARDYGMAFQNIGKIYNNQIWLHIPWPIGPKRPPYKNQPQRGQMSPSAKLNDELVRKIRQSATLGNYGALAEEYGVSVATISNIVNRKSWAHVE